MLIVHLFVSYAHVNLSLFVFILMSGVGTRKSVSLFLFLLVSGVGYGFCLWLFLDFSIFLFAALIYLSTLVVGTRKVYGLL